MLGSLMLYYSAAALVTRRMRFRINGCGSKSSRISSSREAAVAAAAVAAAVAAAGSGGRGGRGGRWRRSSTQC